MEHITGEFAESFQVLVGIAIFCVLLVLSCNVRIVWIAKDVNPLHRMLSGFNWYDKKGLKEHTMVLDSVLLKEPVFVCTESVDPAGVEEYAKLIYNTWEVGNIDWTPWVVRGNSVMQDNARRCARKSLGI